MCVGTQNALGAKVKATKWGAKKNTLNSYKSRSNRNNKRISAHEREREYTLHTHKCAHKNATNFQCDRIKQLHAVCVLCATHRHTHTSSYLHSLLACIHVCVCHSVHCTLRAIAVQSLYEKYFFFDLAIKIHSFGSMHECVVLCDIFLVFSFRFHII